MLIEKLREITGELGWSFNIGRGHWQNLIDFPDDTDDIFEDKQKYFLHLWKDTDFILNEYGAVIKKVYRGEAILCVRSKIDDSDYNYKYENNIRHLEPLIESFVESFSICEEFKVDSIKTVEVENIYDNNLDGVKIKYVISNED
ncbi:hypothetical protein ACFSTE_13270 [Aquimarina hainanensis]|uniref:Uncharacterized protein n=1 Tax=Aquimarina hainanensis TaxID=1578017 RepID=A0ABW5N9H8_9FLAO